MKKLLPHSRIFLAIASGLLTAGVLTGSPGDLRYTIGVYEFENRSNFRGQINAENVQAGTLVSLP